VPDEQVTIINSHRRYSEVDTEQQKLFRKILDPVCEQQPNTVPPKVNHEYIDNLTYLELSRKLNRTSLQSLKDFCAPYVYTRIYLQLGSSEIDSCSIPSPVRGGNCVWYHMCVWPETVDRFISGAILNGLVWEADMLLLSHSILHRNPKGLVLDIGANIGQYTLIAALKGHVVFAFEPVPAHIEMLKKTAILNGIHDKVHFFRNGVGDYTAQTFININKDNKGGSTVDKLDSGEDETKTDPNNRFQDRVGIDLIRLDDVLPILDQLYPHLNITLWKADIEGYEARMFRGAVKLLAEKKPSKILFEILGKSFPRTKCDFRALFDSVNQLGYKIRTLNGILWTHKESKIFFEEFDSQDRLNQFSSDFLLEINTTNSIFIF